MKTRTVLSLRELIEREPAVPWRDGDNIPWHDRAFSERMLAEHLSQEHDLASRRFEIIDAQVGWIHQSLLRRGPSKVLDLGCGPGFYTSRLARLGHVCLGIDYSPAAVAYAEDEARRGDLRCEYLCQDMRRADYGEKFDLVMLINGELNVFRPADAQAIVEKAHSALAEGGLLLVEPHAYDAVRAIGARAPTWRTQDRGLFSDRPHLYLEEHTWDTASETATVRYFIVDGETAEVALYAATYQAYTDDDYAALFIERGFAAVERAPSLTGDSEGAQAGLIALVARKGAAR